MEAIFFGVLDWEAEHPDCGAGEHCLVPAEIIFLDIVLLEFSGLVVVETVLEIHEDGSAVLGG